MLLGKDNLAIKIGKFTGASKTTVYRWYNDGFPHYAIVILKLLEVTERDLWPKV